MFTSDDSVGSFLNIIHSCHHLLQFGFGAKVPFRGAIGHGDFIHDPRDIFLGEAIEDAYLHEAAQAWAGASLTANCVSFIETNGYLSQIENIFEEAAKSPLSESERSNLEENRRRLVLYDVPTQTNPKSGPVIYGASRTYALDWTIRMFEGASSRAIAESSSDHARVMRENTIIFENWARSKGSLSE